MGTKSGIFQIDDFSGGLVTKGSLIKLKPNQTPKCMNVWSTIFGTLHRRYGYAKINSASQAAVCRGLFTFIKTASSKFLLGKFATKLYKMDNGGGTTVWDGTWDEITLGSTLTTGSQMSWDVFKKAGIGTLIFTDDSGTDLMQYWTGTGSTAIIAGAPKCKYIKVWMNHVWAVNCDAFYLLSACDTPWGAYEYQMSNCNSAWTAGTNVTSGTDVTDFKEGTAAVKLTMPITTFTTGIVGYTTITSVDTTPYAYVSMWIKSSVNTNAGDLALLIDNATPPVHATATEDINIPALTANTWTLIQLTLAAVGAGQVSIGLYRAVDLSAAAQTVWLDDIRLQKSNLQNLPASTDHGDFKVGTPAAGASVIISVASGHTTGLIGATEITQIDLSTYTKVDFWVKTDITTVAAGDLKILLDDTIDCSSATTKEAIDLPLLVQNVWTYVSVSLANPTTDTAIRSVGLKVVTDRGAQIIHIDNVRVTFTESDRLTRSAVLYYDDWNGTDSGWDDIFTAQDIGLNAIQDLKGSLYIFKRKSLHRITYLGGRPLIKIEQVKATIGTIAPRTVIPVDVPGEGEYLIFLGADRQLYLFDGYNSKPISEPIQTSNSESAVYMNNITSTTGEDAAMTMCHAINIPDLHWYVLFAPQGAAATAPTHAIVYDYLGKSFWTFDAQVFTASWFGDSGLGSDTSIVGGINYAWLWNSGNSDDGTAIATSWESVKLAPSKMGRPVLKKCRYVEGNSRINGTWPMLFSYRNDWATSYVTTQTVVQSANEWTRDISQVENLIQVKISDTGAAVTAVFPDPYEIYSLDFVGEDLTVGR